MMQRTRRLAFLPLLVLLGLLPPAGPAAAASRDEKLPDLGESHMEIPWADFKKILEELKKGVKPPPPPPPPPVDFVLKRHDLSGTVAGDLKSVAFRSTLDLSVLREDRWVEIPLFRSDVALRAVQIDGRRAAVYQKNGQYHVTLQAPGDHTLTMEFFAAVVDRQGTHSANFHLPQAAVTNVEVTIPRAGIAPQISPAIGLSTREEGRRTRATASLTSPGSVHLAWSKAVGKSEQVERKMTATVQTLFSIGEGLARGFSTIDFQIRYAPAEAFRLLVPKGVAVLEVNGVGIQEWRLEETGEEAAPNRLQVQLNHQAANAYQLLVNTEQSLGGVTAVADLPALKVEDVIREQGFIGVAAATNVEITPTGQVTNLAPLDVSELPPQVTARSAGPVLYGYRYLKHPYALELAVTRHRDLAVKRTVIEQAELTSFLTREGKMLHQLTCRVKNAQKQFLEVTLPGEAEVWGTYLAGRPVKGGVREEGGTILIPLQKSAGQAGDGLETFTVEVIYLTRTRKFGWFGRRRFTAPTIDTQTMDLTWNAYLPEEFTYRRFDGDFKVVEVVPPVPHRADVSEVSSLEEEVYDDENGLGNGRRQRKEAARKSVPQAQAYMSQGAVTNVGQAGGEQQYFAADMAVGVLPVRVQVPRQGKAYCFHRNLVGIDEAPAIAFAYSSAALPGKRDLLLFLATLLITALAIRTFGLARAGEAGPGQILFLLLLVLGLLAAYLYLDARPQPILLGVVVPVLLALAWQWWRHRRRHAEEAPGGPA